MFRKINILFIHIAVLLLLAQSLFAQKKAKDAYTLFDEGVEANESGKYADGVKLFDQCLQLNPGFKEAYFKRGAAKEQLNDLKGALTDYNIYLELQKNNPDATLSRGIVRYRLGLYEQAKEDFLLLFTLPPGETTTVFFKQGISVGETSPIVTTQSNDKSYLLNYLGLIESKLNNFSSAIAYFDSAIQLQPKDANYYVNRGIVKEGMQDSTARLDYEKALQLNNSNALAMNNLAALQSKKGKEKSSIEDQLTNAIENDTTMIYSYVQRALQRLDGGNIKGALDDYNNALKLDSTDVEIWLGRGVVKEKLKDFKGAFSDYTRAIDLKEGYKKAWLNRANVLGKMGRYKEAIEDYSVVITYNSNYAPAYYNRAMAKAQLNQGKEACEDLKIAETLGQHIEEKVKLKICEKMK